jgi:hypothetical protein
MTTANVNRLHMERIMNALAEGDRTPFADAMSEDFAWIFPGNGVWSGAYRGKDFVRRELIAPLFAQFEPGYRNRAVRFVAEGDLVVVECRGSVMTQRGDRYDNAYCYVCRFTDGQLAELTEYMDTALAERVLDPPRTGGTR